MEEGAGQEETGEEGSLKPFLVEGRLPVAISIASGPDWKWGEIATGWWEPETEWLETEGETIPPLVVWVFVQLNPRVADHIDTEHGDFRYRMAVLKPHVAQR